MKFGTPLLNPLESYLEQRPIKQAGRRQKIRHLFRNQPPVVQKLLRKLLWPPSHYRHMHDIPPSVSLVPTEKGTWTLLKPGYSPFISNPLLELKDSITKPAAVIATGPSANDFDWHLLSKGGHVVWAVNGATVMLEERKLKADFLVITDPRFSRDGIEFIQLAIRQGARLVFSHDAAAAFADAWPDVLKQTAFHVFEKVNCWYALARISGDDLTTWNTMAGKPYELPQISRLNVGWSKNAMLGVFGGKTVTFAALQLVVWSGSKEIDIIGLDLGGKRRAYHEASLTISHLEKDLATTILPSFECMRKALAGTRMRTTSHSRISPLPMELIPREDMRS